MVRPSDYKLPWLFCNLRFDLSQVSWVGTLPRSSFYKTCANLHALYGDGKHPEKACKKLRSSRIPMSPWGNNGLSSPFWGLWPAVGRVWAGMLISFNKPYRRVFFGFLEMALNVQGDFGDNRSSLVLSLWKQVDAEFQLEWSSVAICHAWAMHKIRVRAWRAISSR